MTKWTMTLGLLAIVSVLPGCGEAPRKPLPLAEVSGTVQLDGKPMDEPDGEITFLVAGEGPNTLPIESGRFEGKVTVGENRVEIRAYRDGKPLMMNGTPMGEPVRTNYIPDRFNNSSTFTAKIDEGGSSDLKFEIQRK